MGLIESMRDLDQEVKAYFSPDHIRRMIAGQAISSTVAFLALTALDISLWVRGQDGGALGMGVFAVIFGVQAFFAWRWRSQQEDPWEPY